MWLAILVIKFTFMSWVTLDQLVILLRLNKNLDLNFIYTKNKNQFLSMFGDKKYMYIYIIVKLIVWYYKLNSYHIKKGKKIVVTRNTKAIYAAHSNLIKLSVIISMALPS